MRLSPFLFLFVANIWSLPASAAVDCNVINGLERIILAQERLTLQNGQLVGSSAMNVVEQEMRHIDAANVRWAIRDHPLAQHAETLADFTIQASILASYARSGNESGARRLLGNPGNAKIRDAVSALLSIFDCQTLNIDNVVKSSAEARRESARVATPNSPRALLNLKFSTGIFLLIAIAMTLAIWLGNRAFQRHKFQRMRRGKRYTTDIEVVLQTEDSQSEVNVLDISCRGAKFRHDPAMTLSLGQKVSLVVGNISRPATVSWANLHYCGIKFEKTLPLVTVLACVGVKRSKSTDLIFQEQDTKAAP